MTVLYGSNVANGTLASACTMSTTTGGTETSNTTTFISTALAYGEVRSKGGASTPFSAIQAPTGNGWIYFPGVAGTYANATWTAVHTHSCVSHGVDTTIRFYKYSAGTYTSIGQIVTTQTVTAKTTYTNTGTMPSTTLTATEGIYVDMWWHDNNANIGGDNPTNFISNSGTAGVTNDLQITTSTFTPTGGTSTWTAQVRARIATLVTETLQVRARIRTQITKTLQTRARIATTGLTRTLQVRSRIRTLITKTLQTRAILRTQITRTLQVRAILSTANTNTKTLQVRAILRTFTTKTLQIRTRLATAGLTRTLQTRAILRTQITKTLQVRTLIRTLTTKTLQLRARVSTAGLTRTLQVRALIRTLTTRTLQIRARISTAGLTRTLQIRARLRTQITKTLQVRARIRTFMTRTLQVRGIIITLRTKTLQIRARILTRPTMTLQVRAIIAAPGLASGGFTLFANGTGTAQFDSFRVTEFPDPALSLAPILPRLGTTGISWNALTPTNTTLGMDISYDGVTWTDVTSMNGGALPTLFSQPAPIIDGFDLDTHTSYASTNKAGGAVGTWTFDTTKSRLVATGGTTAIYTYTGISRADIDIFADLDQADAGGLVWRFVDPNNFYYIAIGDSLASVGTKNTITLYKVVANVQTQLATAPLTFTRGTFSRFRVTMLTSAITVYVDGTSTLTATDTSIVSAGRVGLFNNGGVTGSRYYQLWMLQVGDYVSGNPPGDVVTGTFVYTRQRLATTDPTVSPQVEDVTTNAFTPDIQQGVLIPSVTYNKAFLNKNFDDLAKQSNYSWYIGPDSRFRFQDGGTIPAPWIAQSAPAGLVTTVDIEVDSNLELDVGNDLYRNRQTVLGAVDIVTAPASFIGDGNTTSFTVGYPLAAQPTILLNGVAQSVGLKGLTGYQWYYAINDPVIQQDAGGTVLQDTDQLTIPTYQGYVTVDVTVDNVVEQAARQAIEGGTGIVEAVEDHSSDVPQMSKDAATTLANQLIARYAIAGRTLIFMTSRNGLQVGQTLSIFFPESGIWDGQFLINQIEITLQKGVGDTQIWWSKVTCSELPRQASWAKIIASGLGLQ